MGNFKLETLQYISCKRQDIAKIINIDPDIDECIKTQGTVK